MKRVPVAFVVHRHKVHHHHVHGLRVQAADAHLERGEHATSGFRDNHLGALLVELVPQLFGFQHNDGVHQRRMAADRAGAAVRCRCRSRRRRGRLFCMTGARGFIASSLVLFVLLLLMMMRAIHGLRFRFVVTD